jgi:peptidoglycan hydrolase-like protein with peptidoglycan-binding domain
MAGDAPAPAPVPAKDGQSRPTLRRGDHGDAVRQMQAGLGVPADGSFGPMTEAAVRAFQRKHQLVPDGIFGPRSWAALPPAPDG